MKTFAAIILSLLLAGCASAMPPAHKALALVVTVPPGVPTSAAVNVYYAQQADTNWTGPVTVKLAGNQATLPMPIPAAELYTATVTNSGSESDYGPVLTNLPAPGVMVK